MSINKPAFYRALYDWYDQNRRNLPWRETTDPYRIWLSEIILQQTRVDQGLPYYLRFVSEWPTVNELANASEDQVLRQWQGLGYYSRARNLHKGAQLIAAGTICNDDSSRQQGFPATFAALRLIPGVGDYTAGAIASFAYNLPYPAMDGNVYRVLARLYDIDIPFDTSEGKRYFHEVDMQLLDTNQPRIFNSAIMEFGALYCTPNIDEEIQCIECPLRAYCKGYQAHTAALLPVRKARPKLRDRYLHYTIYLSDQKTLIQQRQQKDIWQHLWEFPLQETESPTPHTEPQTGSHSTPHTEPDTLHLTHVLSHQRLHADFVVKKLPYLPYIEGCIEVSINDLDQYAFSRLTLKALEKLHLC